MGRSVTSEDVCVLTRNQNMLMYAAWLDSLTAACSTGIHSSKKGKAASHRKQGPAGYGWQKKKALEKSKKFKKWKTVSGSDKRQFSR